MTSFTPTTLNYPQLANTAIRRVRSHRAPLSTDKHNFVPGDLWFYIATGVNNAYILVDIVSGAANWVLLGTTPSNLTNLKGDDGQSVIPDSGGAITLLTGTVAAGSQNQALFSEKDSTNAMIFNIQVASAQGSSLLSQAGVCSFSNSQFDVDSNGFVTLAQSPGMTTEFTVDTFTSPGTNPVVPNVNGNVTVTGGQVAAGTIGANVIQTNSLAANTYTIQIQQTTTAASTNSAKNGVAHFNSSQFTADTHGFISLVGTGPAITQFMVDTSSGGGTNPVVPSGTGLITVTGGQVAANTVGANVIQTASTSANQYAIQIQQTTTAASTNSAKNGVAHFNSASFTVDAHGFVSLIAGSGINQVTVDAHTNPGTNPVLPDGSNNINITGGQVAAGAVGTNVIQTDSLAANTFTIQIQRSTTASSSTVADNGVCHFNSGQFNVDSNGFVSIIGGGYSWVDVTGVSQTIAVETGYVADNAGLITFTLPATAAFGTTFRIVGKGAGGWKIVFNTGQTIHFGNTVATASSGNIASTAQGDCVEIVTTTTNTDFTVISSMGNISIT